MANPLLANAPIREINKSSFGMPMARPAKKKMLKCFLVRKCNFITCYDNNYCTTNSQFMILVLFTQQCSQWRLKEVHGYIELYQIGDKDGVGKVKLCDVVYSTGEGDKSIARYSDSYTLSLTYANLHAMKVFVLW